MPGFSVFGGAFGRVQPHFRRTFGIFPKLLGKSWEFRNATISWGRDSLTHFFCQYAGRNPAISTAFPRLSRASLPPVPKLSRCVPRFPVPSLSHRERVEKAGAAQDPEQAKSQASYRQPLSNM
jgi:hypothetical protein